MALPMVNYRPKGKPPAYAKPEAMFVNQEIWRVLSEHYAVPAWPDGQCVCGDDEPEGQMTHLIEVLKSYQGGNMPSFTEEETVDTVTPFVEVAHLAPDLTDYDIRLDSIALTLQLQTHKDDYANVLTLLDEAKTIYDWLTENFVD